MILTLNTAQMLRAWRISAGLEPVDAACSVTRFDGVDMDAALVPHLRSWYLRLLDGGDARLLGPAAEAAGLLRVESDGMPYDARLLADGRVRRVVAVRMASWKRETRVLTAAEAAPGLALMTNPYTAPGVHNPLAWQADDGSIHVTPVYRDPSLNSIVSAKAYIDPGTDSYIFDEAALATLPKII